MADFIQTIDYGEEAVATFIAVVDVWPSGDFVLEIVSFTSDFSGPLSVTPLKHR